jgi:hypothetical protein
MHFAIRNDILRNGISRQQATKANFTMWDEIQLYEKWRWWGRDGQVMKDRSAATPAQCAAGGPARRFGLCSKQPRANDETSTTLKTKRPAW